MANYTLQADAQTIKAMQSYYQDQIVAQPQYTTFQAKLPGVTITAYNSGKVVFQGKAIDTEVQRWQGSGGVTESKKQQQKSSSQTKEQVDWTGLTVIGSDEVGNGSYFGALTVCAVYLSPDKTELVQELGAQDSKQLSDAKIREIAWQLQASVPYHLTICNPSDYNQANQTRNANAIKVSLHNHTLQRLLAKLDDAKRQQLDAVIIDQFVSPKRYYEYLAKEAHPYQGSIHFTTQGESAHLAVACASIIARAAFLDSLEKLGQPYHCTLPSGAGSKVDLFASRLIQQYGDQVLPQLAKMHFKNTEKAKKLAKKPSR